MDFKKNEIQKLKRTLNINVGFDYVTKATILCSLEESDYEVIDLIDFSLIKGKLIISFITLSFMAQNDLLFLNNVLKKANFDLNYLNNTLQSLKKLNFNSNLNNKISLLEKHILEKQSELNKNIFNKNTNKL